ncbi:lysophospholipase [Thioflavicoccus mobilis 8321]|uniref:Lysophospholipase n=1 Tax=Thioflavicoccus mobilis 8321 TaxID=765912 RepID=L0GUN3_9GAMM|nr:alpha/beta fold hydrolase [Thioflavicoccus mobilis]AGA89716.1 lysophospholipase [Thioflavicoccus mobilis 8321]
MRHIALALAALLLIAAGLWPLGQDLSGITIRSLHVGATPVTVFEPATRRPAPAVVIAHGFAGSRQLMQSFAVTLAHHGYVALTFDFPGHGRNPTPLQGGLADPERRSETLSEALAPIVDFARTLPEVDGRVALLGHSMATDVVVRYARAHPDIAATVAVSPFSDQVTATSPRNLLVIYGVSEPDHLRAVGEGMVAMAAAGAVVPGETYGRFADGSARRFVLAPGVEHTGVVFSGASLAAAVDWLDRTFDRSSGDAVATRGLALGLLFLGILLLARPLAELLPRVAPAPVGGGRPWRQLLPLALAPAVLTPLILARLPHGTMPLLLGDYLVLHFGLYGLLTALGLWLVRPPTRGARGARIAWGRFVIAAAAVAAYVTLAIGLPLDRLVTSYVPTGGRVPLAFVMLAGTLLFFLADEWLTRGPTAPRGAYPLTKACFLLSLTIAILLNLRELFFLAIIMPVMLIFFVVYGLFSRWAYRCTNVPLVGGLANAIAFAWGIAATFPVIAQ